ncbi:MULTISPECIES: hypothetical protein [unclassified Streptomyces]|uniref:hypothetical protein n=1 Tax=unclassified Streptomyces TaxID=2593676 RepID=UPI0033CFA561
MSTPRRPLGTGPRTADDEQSRTDEPGDDGTAVEGAPAAGVPLPPPKPGPVRGGGRRPLGSGPDTPGDR